MLVQDEAIILQAFAYSETSKVLRLLTSRHGMLSVMARGALRPRSAYGGVLEPFSRGSATVHVKQGRELQTLSGFELSRSGHPLARDLIRFAAASLLAELVLRTSEEGAENALFHALDRALDALADAPDDLVESVALAQGWSLVAQLGYAPVLDACVRCGRPLSPAEDGFFDYANGGARCEPCGPGRDGRTLPASARLALIDFCGGRAAEIPRSAAHWRLFANFLRFHVLEHGTLKSMGVLASALEGRP